MRPPTRLVSLARVAGTVHAALLMGIDRLHCHGDGRIEHSNSHQFVAADGNLLAAYDKMHPVMFGEYVPLAESFSVSLSS